MSEEDGHREVSQYDVIQAYKEFAATQEGQIVIADLMRRFGYSRQSTYSPGEAAQDVTFREGQRVVLVHIGRMIDADPAEAQEYDRSEL